MSPRRTLIAVAVLAGGLLVTFALVRLRPEVERQEVSTPPPLVRVVTVERTDHPLDVSSQGTVAPRTKSTLVAQVAGRILRVSPAFAAGGFFDRGELLVEIDPADYRLALEEAQAAVAQAAVRLELEEAQADVARREWTELGRGEASALVKREPQVAEARAAVAAAEAAVERARLHLARTRVTAPFAGRVESTAADVGQYVAPGAPLAAVYSTEAAEIRLPVAQRELGYLEVDLGAPGTAGANGSGHETAGPRVRLTAAVGGRRQQWDGRVVRTAGSIDPRSRMLDLFARVDNPFRRNAAGDGDGGPLPMGLFVEATIAGRVAEGVILLPRAALRDDDRVLVADGDDRLRFRRVEVLRSEGDRVVIAAGLEAGERVNVSPLATVVDGMKVRTVEDAEAGRPSDGDGLVDGLEDPT